MAQNFSKSFYKSKAWQDCRRSYISSVQGLCEVCLSNNKYVNGYIVHHKIKLTPDNINDPEITLNHKHLEYMCLDCHNIEHGVTNNESCVRDGLKFNMYGELVVDC